jgi:hypothetical protein
MKFQTKWRQFLTLFATILVLGACGGDDKEKSEEEVQLDKLRGSWTISSVDNDGLDRTDEYPGMKITLSGTYAEGGTYSLASTATDWPSISPWKKDDSWKFNSAAVSSVIVRLSDTVDLNYTLGNDDSQLTVEFDYSGPGFNNGRVATVGGHWTFTFSR